MQFRALRGDTLTFKNACCNCSLSSRQDLPPPLGRPKFRPWSEFSLPKNQARKKSTKINFLGPETARWGGGLPLEGVVAENFVPALESLSSLGFEQKNLGCPGNFAGMSRTPGGAQKVCAKKLCAHFSFPKKLRPWSEFLLSLVNTQSGFV